jgi:hypothetical protein
MHSQVLCDAMQAAEDFLHCMPSVKHLAEYAAWVKAIKAQAAAVQQQQAVSSTTSTGTDTAVAPVDVVDDSSAVSTRSLGITAETWVECTAAYTAYGFAAQPGPGSIMQAASGCKMRGCKCRRGERLHIREGGCGCDCVHCDGCNFVYCVCGLKKGSVCTDVLCTCTSVECYRALNVPVKQCSVALYSAIYTQHNPDVSAHVQV